MSLKQCAARPGGYAHIWQRNRRRWRCMCCNRPLQPHWWELWWLWL